MKIIIPASGIGKRFIEAGYKETKPLIQVTKDKKIFDYVFDMFDRENDEFYIITSKHTYDVVDDFLQSTNINYVHLNCGETKPGPVGAVNSVKDKLSTFIKESDDVIVTYCDYGMEWDYEAFKDFVNSQKPDAVIPCYTGYHPHLEDENNVYAACKMDGDAVIQVKEKYKSKNRFEEQWSPGLYYFNSFGLMNTAFERLIASNDTLNSEYYCSMAYNHIPESDIKIFPVDKFYQFGTPKDFELAKHYLNVNTKNSDTNIKNTIVLSAGKGERFFNLGYTQPKPFLPINDSDLIHEITNSFKNETEFHYVASDAHKLYWENSKLDNVSYVPSNKIGAAYSYKLGCSDIKGETLIVPCDLLAKYFTNEFNEIKKSSDVIIFTSDANEYARKNVNSFAWVKGTDNKIESISVKCLDGTPDDAMVLIGSFWIRSNETLLNEIEYIMDHDMTVNGEYYLDTAFQSLFENANLKVNYVKVEDYLSFGTPDEYNVSKYWLKG